MAIPLDCDQPHSTDELARHMEIDVRFFNVAQSAGLNLDSEGRTTTRAFWHWFVEHFEAFRCAAGMRPAILKKSLRGPARDRARIEAALLTIVEFFGVLPFEKVVNNAIDVLKPKRPRRRR